MKTSRKRITLFIISGIIIFLAITGFLMVWFSYRYSAFGRYIDAYHDWNSDNMISVFSSKVASGIPDFDVNYISNFTYEFKTAVNSLIPGVASDQYTSALSAQFHYFYSLENIWLDYELMTLDDLSYPVLENCLVDGRLPENSSELLYYPRYSFSNYEIGDNVTIYAIANTLTPYHNYTVVGVVRNLDTLFPTYGFSGDLFEWSFEVGEFDLYNKEEIFFTNRSNFTEIINSYNLFSGIIMQAVDFDYDITTIDLKKLYDYINTFPQGSNYYYSGIVGYYVDVCPDLREALINFANFWTEEVADIISISAPLLFLIGIISYVTLNIGSRELERTFRIMKLKGLDYKYIRKVIFQENIFLTLISMLAGSALGILVGYFFSLNIENRPQNFYLNLLTEPTLYICIGAFIFILFGIGFYIENSIAKSTVKVLEPYKAKREKLRKLLSTNEFRLLVITLIVSIIAWGGYLLYRYLGPSTFYTTMWSYIFIFWFLIIASIALLGLFIFLLLARLLTVFWNFLGSNIWENEKNLLTLSIKHISFNRQGYQKIVLVSLIFGLGFLPGLIMKESTNQQLALEAELSVGCADLAITNWFDPSENKRSQIEAMTYVDNLTEITIYKIFNYNEYLYYPRAFTMNLLVIEEPRNFTNIIDFTLLEEQNITKEDILAFESGTSFFMDKKYTRKRGFQHGDPFRSTDFSIQRDEFNLTFKKSFDYFPLLPLPKKDLFYQFMDYYSIVTNRATANMILDSQGLDSNIAVNKYLLITPTNLEHIPEIKYFLRDLRFTAYTAANINNNLYLSISPFSNNILIITSVLMIFSLLFVGFFSAREIYMDRVRIIESFYRVGANRTQIWGSFTIELIFTAILPIILSSFVYLPFYKVLGVSFLNISEYYHTFQTWKPAWLLVLTVLIGLISITVGWIVGLIPLVRSYKPIKQE